MTGILRIILLQIFLIPFARYSIIGVFIILLSELAYISFIFTIIRKGYFISWIEITYRVLSIIPEILFIQLSIYIMILRKLLPSKEIPTEVQITGLIMILLKFIIEIISGIFMLGYRIKTQLTASKVPITSAKFYYSLKALDIPCRIEFGKKKQ